MNNCSNQQLIQLIIEIHILCCILFKMCWGRCGESGIKHHNPNPYSVCCDFHRMAKITCNLVSSHLTLLIKYLKLITVSRLLPLITLTNLDSPVHHLMSSECHPKLWPMIVRKNPSLYLRMMQTSGALQEEMVLTCWNRAPISVYFHWK
jgi:hypothetical protein